VGQGATIMVGGLRSLSIAAFAAAALALALADAFTRDF
jgi:hypothetical protein